MMTRLSLSVVWNARSSRWNAASLEPAVHLAQPGVFGGARRRVDNQALMAAAALLGQRNPTPRS